MVWAKNGLTDRDIRWWPDISGYEESGGGVSRRIVSACVGNIRHVVSIATLFDR